MHTFSTQSGRWVETKIKAKMEAEPFAKGGLRIAYHLQFTDEEKSQVRRHPFPPFCLFWRFSLIGIPFF